MSGHNKWSTIKHRKGAQDAKRSKIFTKIIRELTIAARIGGGDPKSNPRLRTAISNARGASMPSDNVDRAIKRGTGELEGVEYEEIVFEGYAPGGVAMVIDCLTDNRNRTTAEVKHMLSKYNGKLGTAGSVLHQFDRKGVVLVTGENLDEDTLMETVLEIDGFEDMTLEDGAATIYTESNKVNEVAEALETAEFKVESSSVDRVPSLTVQIEGKVAEQVMRLIDYIDDLDDVQTVSANYDIDDAEMERIANQD